MRGLHHQSFWKDSGERCGWSSPNMRKPCSHAVSHIKSPCSGRGGGSRRNGCRAEPGQHLWGLPLTWTGRGTGWYGQSLQGRIGVNLGPFMKSARMSPREAKPYALAVSMATRGPVTYKPKQDPSLQRTEEDTPPQRHTHPAFACQEGARAAPGGGVILTLPGRVGGVRLVVGGGWGRGRLLLTEEIAQASSESIRSHPRPLVLTSAGPR